MIKTTSPHDKIILPPLLPQFYYKFYNNIGVTIDFNLKWSENVQNIKSKLRSLTVLFYKIRFIGKIVIRLIYKSLCNSIVGEALIKQALIHCKLPKKLL